MYSLSDRAKARIEKITGVSILEINSLSLSDEKDLVLKKNNNALFFSRRKRGAVAGRGNPLLARKKIRTMEEVDKYLDDITTT